MASAPVKLYYFDKAGRAEAVRLAFSIGHVAFEDIRFKKEDVEQYKSKSPTGMFPIVELADGSVLVESSAIMMYAAKIGDAELIPEDPTTFAAMMMIIQYVEGMLNNASAIFRNPDESAKKEQLEKLGAAFPSHCEKLYAVYKQFAPKTDGKFLFGDKPTVADIHMSCLLGGLLSGEAPVTLPKENIEKTCPKFLTILENLMEIPEVKEYKAKHATPSA